MTSCFAFSNIIKKRYRDLISALNADEVVVITNKLSPKSLHLILA
jgi:hypothetical protein